VTTIPGTFRTAVESKDLSAITSTLDPAIEFHSPVVVRPYQGRDAVAALIRVLLEVFEDFHYTDELVSSAHDDLSDQLCSPPTQALIFKARVMDKSVQGLDLIRFNDAGLVSGLTVMIRPLPAAMTLARLVGRRMEERASPF